MSTELLFVLLLAAPAASGLLAQLGATPWRTLLLGVAGVFVAAGIGTHLVVTAYSSGPQFAFTKWLFIDDLSAFHLAVLLLVFTLSSLFALRYFGEELREGHLSLPQARTFAGLWGPALAAMILVLISNNLGIMWVGMEATTLLTAFLICVHIGRGALEAMWKYMLVCSVGIGFAFLGTLMIRLAAKDLPLDPNQALLWTNLMAYTGRLAPELVKAAFIFVLVGYGTKAGLAPMHSWLPDAHSKAPAPVSAVFSGFMLNTALYCIMRYVPIVEGTTGHAGFALRLLIGFGLFSIALAAAFVVAQRDVKRLLAYCSVEHLGIIALGYGLGGAGTFAALFHTLNHSLCKTVSFFAAGRLGQVFGTHEMARMSGSMRVAPVWGATLFACLLALVGMAPFSLFMSEFQVVRAAVDSGGMLVAAVFLLGVGAIFMAMLGQALPLALGDNAEVVENVPVNLFDIVLMVGPVAVLVILGIYMPETLQQMLQRAAAVVHTVGGGMPGGLR